MIWLCNASVDRLFRMAAEWIMNTRFGLRSISSRLAVTVPFVILGPWDRPENAAGFQALQVDKAGMNGHAFPGISIA